MNLLYSLILFSSMVHGQAVATTHLEYAQYHYELYSKGETDLQRTLINYALTLGFDPADPSGKPDDNIFPGLIEKYRININGEPTPASPNEKSQGPSFLCQFASTGLNLHLSYYQRALSSKKAEDEAKIWESLDRILTRLEVARADFGSPCGDGTVYDVLSKNLKLGMEDPLMSQTTQANYSRFLDRIDSLASISHSPLPKSSLLEVGQKPESFQINNILVQFKRSLTPECIEFEKEGLIKNTMRALAYSRKIKTDHRPIFLFHDFSANCLLYTWVRVSGPTLMGKSDLRQKLARAVELVQNNTASK